MSGVGICAYDKNNERLMLKEKNGNDYAPSMTLYNVEAAERAIASIKTGKVIQPNGQMGKATRRIAYFRIFILNMIFEVIITKHGANHNIEHKNTMRSYDLRTPIIRYIKK